MKTRSFLIVALMLAASPLFAEDKKDDKSLVVDKEKKTIRIACKIAPRKLANLTEVYPIEVVACWGAPKGQKAHETIVTHEIKPSDLHKALESLGIKAGKPAKGENSVAEGPELKISLEFAGPADTTRKLPIEKTLIDKKTGKTMPNVKWRFTGSAMKQPDPSSKDEVYGADTTGTLIGIFPVTDETVIQTSLTMKEEPFIKMETNKDALPKEGESVTLVIEVK
jgi:hypothetical protein